MTYTYAILEVSSAAYREIKQKLEAAGYEDQIIDDLGGDRGVIDMHGIAIAEETK
jgi:hypothetical protein